MLAFPLTLHTRWQVFPEILIYLTYSFGKEPKESVWKWETELGREMGKLYIYNIQADQSDLLPSSVGFHADQYSFSFAGNWKLRCRIQECILGFQLGLTQLDQLISTGSHFPHQRSQLTQSSPRNEMAISLFYLGDFF